MDATPLVPAGTSAGGLHSSYVACYISFLLCVFERDQEEPKITHIGRNVTMETRRQFRIVWPVLTQLL